MSTLRLLPNVAATPPAVIAERMAAAHGTDLALTKCLRAAAIWERGTDSAIAGASPEVKAENAAHYFEVALAIDGLPFLPDRMTRITQLDTDTDA